MNSREKGKRGEREFAQHCREHGIEAHRGQQYCGGAESPDVKTPGVDVHWEVKRTERLNIRDALAQAEGDAKQKPWAVMWKRNNGEWIALIKSTFLFELLRESKFMQPSKQQEQQEQEMRHDTAKQS